MTNSSGSPITPTFQEHTVPSKSCNVTGDDNSGPSWDSRVTPFGYSSVSGGYTTTGGSGEAPLPGFHSRQWFTKWTQHSGTQTFTNGTIQVSRTATFKWTLVQLSMFEDIAPMGPG